MPACFALKKKGQRGPENLQDIDAELCEAFGIPLNPKRWLGYDQFGNGGDWYNYIGFRLALGWDWAKIDEEIAEEENPHYVLIRQCLTYLRLNYTSDAWHDVNNAI